MKRIIVLFAACVAIFACRPENPPSGPIIADSGQPEGQNPEEGKVRPRRRTVGVQEDSFITIEDVTSLIGNREATIDAFVGSEEDTLMYIVNYANAGGWKIVSADRRTPAILAEGEKGSFTLDAPETGIASWIDGVACNMAAIRKAPDEKLTFSRRDIRLHRSFWSKEPLRGIDTTNLRGPGEPGGHWEIDTTATSEPYDSIVHMVGHWDQNQPYNRYCPTKLFNSTERAPVGCVAIAGSQVLYYLYTQYGLPETLVDSCFCSGPVYAYTRNFYGNSSAVMSAIDTEYHHPDSSYYDGGTESLLFAYVGELVDMVYNDGFSYALPANLRTNVFEPFGFSCQHGDYSLGIVKNNLLAGLPVIMIATNMLIPADFNIHAFVIDGYKRERTKYTYYHHWEPNVNPLSSGNTGNDPRGGGFPGFEPIDNYYTYEYSSPMITGFKINWGWWTQWIKDPLNDGWYSLIDDWHVEMISGAEYTYNYNRQMIYGFAVDNS